MSMLYLCAASHGHPSARQQMSRRPPHSRSSPCNNGHGLHHTCTTHITRKDMFSHGVPALCASNIACIATMNFSRYSSTISAGGS
eukprot:365676-Chlamydomonas_euryale.AAC.5